MTRVTRRNVLKGGTALVGGVAGILATGRPPAFAQGTTIQWLRWNDFVPASDQLLRKELIPAAERGIVDGVEWINPANDLPLGLHDVFKFYSIQGLHQAIDIADVMFNGAKWRSLPPDLQAIVETALTTSLFDAMLYFAHENAKALKEIRAKGVTIFDAPADYAPAFIKSAKKVLANLEAKDPFFKKVLESQRAFANVVVPYTRETSKLSTLISGAAEVH